MSTIVVVIECLLFTYFLMVNGYYIFTSTVALMRLPWFVKLHMTDPVKRLNSMLEQPVSFLVPAFNEREIIVQSLESILALDYVNFEVIVINDGSTDDTFELLDAAFELEPYEGVYRAELATAEIIEVYQSAKYPDLRVINKANGGKGDSLNAGINLARFPLVFSADADSYYHRQTLQWMTEPFAKDRRTVAVGGAIAVGLPERNPADGTFETKLPKKMIQRFQVLEYLRAFLGTRMGFAPFNALGIVSGACGLWKRDVLTACGGFRADTIWEDMEMTLRVHNYCIQADRPYRVAFTPYPVCWTDVPATLNALYNQRKGWHRHLSECMMIHRRLFFRRGGVFSWVTMPYLWLFEWLAPVAILFGTLFSIAGAVLGFLDWPIQLWLLGLVFTLAMLGSVAAILLDEVSFRAYKSSNVWALLFAAFLENLGYRQFVMIANLMGIVAWVTRQPIRGDAKYPGVFVPAWKPGKATAELLDPPRRRQGV